MCETIPFIYLFFYPLPYQFDAEPINCRTHGAIVLNLFIPARILFGFGVLFLEAHFRQFRHGLGRLGERLYPFFPSSVSDTFTNIKYAMKIVHSTKAPLASFCVLIHFLLFISYVNKGKVNFAVLNFVFSLVNWARHHRVGKRQHQYLILQGVHINIDDNNFKTKKYMNTNFHSLPFSDRKASARA